MTLWVNFCRAISRNARLLYSQEADIRLPRNIRRRDYTTARNSLALAMAQAVSNRRSLLPASNSPGVRVG